MMVTKFRLQWVIVNESGHEQVQEVARIETRGSGNGNPRSHPGGRQADLEEDPGGRGPGADLARRCHCPDCGKARHSKGYHDITIRTLFGNIELKSPRLEHCRYQPHVEKTFSPLQAILPEHTSPEMLYLEVKWSSLLPYEVNCI